MQASNAAPVPTRQTASASAEVVFVARGLAKTYQTGEVEVLALRDVDLQYGLRLVSQDDDVTQRIEPSVSTLATLWSVAAGVTRLASRSPMAAPAAPRRDCCGSCWRHRAPRRTPRGGRSLIDRVTAESRVPVLRHYDGICHVYVDRDADIAMARDVVANAKMRRVSVCGAAETLLIDRAALDTHLAPVLARLHALGCEVRGDAEARGEHDVEQLVVGWPFAGQVALATVAKFRCFECAGRGSAWNASASKCTIF